MLASRPFLFDRQFGGNGTGTAVAGRSVANDRPPQQRFDEHDLARARADGVAEGLAQASARAEADDRRRLAVACEAIAAQLAGLFRGIEAHGAEAVNAATLVAVAVARKLLPETCRRHGLTEIEGMLASVLRHLQHQPRIVVSVHPGMVEGAGQRVSAIAAGAGYEGRIAVVADPSIGVDEYWAQWADGGAIRRPSDIWNEIDGILERTIGAEAGGSVVTEAAALGSGADDERMSVDGPARR